MRRLRFRRVSWPTVVWISLVWVLLWGDFSPANILAGAIIGVVVPSVLPLPRIPWHGTIRPRYVAVLMVRFFADLVVASFQVAALAFNPRHMPHGAVVGVATRSDSDLYLTMTAEIVTLVPGSVVVEAIRSNGMLYVHVIDLELSGGVEKVRQSVLATEGRVLRAFASAEELAKAKVTL